MKSRMTATLAVRGGGEWFEAQTCRGAFLVAPVVVHALVQCNTGTMVHWCIGTVYIGTVVLWNNGTLVHWYSVQLVQWFSCAVVHWDTGTYWYIGTLLVQAVVAPGVNTPPRSAACKEGGRAQLLVSCPHSSFR